MMRSEPAGSRGHSPRTDRVAPGPYEEVSALVTVRHAY